MTPNMAKNMIMYISDFSIWFFDLGMIHSNCISNGFYIIIYIISHLVDGTITDISTSRRVYEAGTEMGMLGMILSYTSLNFSKSDISSSAQSPISAFCRPDRIEMSLHLSVGSGRTGSGGGWPHDPLPVLRSYSDSIGKT